VWRWHCPAFRVSFHGLSHHINSHDAPVLILLPAMVTHGRLPSLEDLPPHRRSITVAALRRGQIKISEPVPLENSGPSPVWKSPPSSPPPFATDSVTGFRSVDGVPPHQQPLADVNDHQPLYSESHMRTSADSRADQLNLSKVSHGQPLRPKRSSLFMKEPRDAGLPKTSVDLSGRRSSANESGTDSTMSPQNKKKRRSGSLRLAFRKIFNKRDPRPVTSPSSSGRRGHEYHKSVSFLFFL
jgi:hypothetical protein